MKKFYQKCLTGIFIMGTFSGLAFADTSPADQALQGWLSQGGDLARQLQNCQNNAQLQADWMVQTIQMTSQNPYGDAYQSALLRCLYGDLLFNQSQCVGQAASSCKPYGLEVPSQSQIQQAQNPASESTQPNLQNVY